MRIKYRNEKEINFDIEHIDKMHFNHLSYIYSFTTENIAGYYPCLDFENKSILTVASSGDHIINAFYKGAKKVSGFDINYLALVFTELKLVALANLDYEEFLQFFMINEKNNLHKNKKALDYDIYINKLKKNLTPSGARYLDILYQNFHYDGFKLRNSFIFHNQYDDNKLKIKSNLYLKSKKDYHLAREKIKDKEIELMHANYRDLFHLPNLEEYDIMLMSNISDYIKNIYHLEPNYLNEYIKEITKNFKNKINIIVCAYIYDIYQIKHRSQIDDPILRKEVFDKLKIPYMEKEFKSVMDQCTDGIIVI